MRLWALVSPQLTGGRDPGGGFCSCSEDCLCWPGMCPGDAATVSPSQKGPVCEPAPLLRQTCSFLLPTVCPLRPGEAPGPEATQRPP